MAHALPTPAEADKQYTTGLLCRALSASAGTVIKEDELTFRALPPSSSWLRATLAYEGSLRLQDMNGVAVVCHGLNSWRNQVLIESLSRGLAGSGTKLASLRLDFQGNGSSGGEWGYDFSESREVDDVEAAIRYVETELRKPVLVLAGHSQGR